MIGDKKVIIVLPAYNSEKTIIKVLEEIPKDIVDDIVLVDDNSSDKTIELGKKFGLKNIILHLSNLGYGANQKTCYDKALELEADIIIMLHPDYQYTPKLIHSMAYLIADGVYEVVLGSRILGKGAIKGGMPVYKYVFNRILTYIQNMIMNQKLSEYHTGYRAYSSNVLNRINYKANSNDFVFDNQVICQIFMAGFDIAEITCPTNYFPDASSINFKKSLKYGLGCISTSIKYFLHRKRLMSSSLFNTGE